MSLGFGTRRGVGLLVMTTGLAVCASAQTSITLTEPSGPLLPQKFGEWTKAASSGETPSYSLMTVDKDALKECGLQRSQVADYTRGGRDIHVEAIQFGDRTGATSAFTLVERPGMTVGKDLGSSDAVGVSSNSGGAVLFTVGSSVVLANFGGTASLEDIAALKPLVEAMPKAWGNKGVAPLLPALLPVKGLVAGSVRYALGPLSYQAEGGTLPVSSLGWDKEAEGAMALYDDARGKETLTVLLYPTPTIAEGIVKSIRGELPTVKVRRDGALVVMASGSFAAGDTQRMVDGVHLSSMTFNQDVQPPFHVVARQAATLLENIAILSGVLGAAAVLLGLFLGVGRATFRVMRGKPAAVEVEFLSLHLAPQNKPAEFHQPDPAERN